MCINWCTLLKYAEMERRNKNIGAQPARLLVMFMPAGVEEAFMELSQLPQNGSPDFQAVTAILHKYGVETVLPPGA